MPRRVLISGAVQEEWVTRDPTSQKFVRTRMPWEPTDWDNGHVNNKGRFLVYRPDCPRAYADGYALRSHVVWWLHTGKGHSHGLRLHHKNGDRLDDRAENLELCTQSDHLIAHRGNYVELTCKQCGREFLEKQGRVNSREVKFCSQGCYHKYPKSAEQCDAHSARMRKWHADRRLA